MAGADPGGGDALHPVSVYITRKRGKSAALTFMKKALKRHGTPETIVTDGLRSCCAAPTGRTDDRTLPDQIIKPRTLSQRSGHPRMTAPHRDHGRPAEGLAPGRNPLRPLLNRLLLRARRRRRRALPAMISVLSLCVDNFRSSYIRPARGIALTQVNFGDLIAAWRQP